MVHTGIAYCHNQPTGCMPPSSFMRPKVFCNFQVNEFGWAWLTVEEEKMSEVYEERVEER